MSEAVYHTIRTYDGRNPNSVGSTRSATKKLAEFASRPGRFEPLSIDPRMPCSDTDLLESAGAIKLALKRWFCGPMTPWNRGGHCFWFSIAPGVPFIDTIDETMGNLEYTLQMSSGCLRGEVVITIRTPSEGISIEDVYSDYKPELAR
jgi:hypothetical protein